MSLHKRAVAGVGMALAVALLLGPPAGAQKPDPGSEPGAEADLTLEVTGPERTPGLGSTFELEFRVVNAGPEEATDAYLHGYLSESLAAVSLPPPCSPDPYGGFACPLGPLPASAEAAVEVTVERTRAREAWASFSTSSSNYDPNYENNYSELYLEPDSSSPADVAVTVEGPNDPEVGTEFDYVVAAANEGPERATGVELRVSLPYGVELLEWAVTDGEGDCRTAEQPPYAEDGGPRDDYMYQELACSAAAVEPSETFEIHARVRRDDPYELWTSAWAITSSYDPNYENDYATHTTAADDSVTSDLSARIETPGTPPATGDAFDLVFTAGNEGPAPARDAWLYGFLPDGVAFESARTNTESVECSATGYGGGVARPDEPTDDGGSGPEPAPAEPAPGGGQDGSEGGGTPPPGGAAPEYYGGTGFNCALGSLGAGDSVDVVVERRPQLRQQLRGSPRECRREPSRRPGRDADRSL